VAGPVGWPLCVHCRFLHPTLPSLQRDCINSQYIPYALPIPYTCKQVQVAEWRDDDNIQAKHVPLCMCIGA